jgi:hypothetical protein
MTFGLLSMLLTLVLLVAATGVGPFMLTAARVRRAVLAGAGLFGVLLVGLTELLGCFGLLDRRVVPVTWLVCAIASGGVLVFRWWLHRDTFRVCSGTLRRAVRNEIGRLRRHPGRMAILVTGAVFLVCMAVIAWVAPPNTTDSMTYRLTRVMHWVHQQSVDFFATEMPRQNHRAPFVEWIFLHLFLVTGNDRFFNFVQLACFVLGLVGVYELAGMFTQSAARRWFAVVMVMTLPMAVLQATSTQSDLAASLALVGFLVFGFRVVDDRDSAVWFSAVLCGVFAALGVLCKTPNIVYAAIFALIWLAQIVVQGRWMRFVPGAMAVVVASMVISGHSFRNHNVYGHILGPPGDPPPREHDRSDVHVIAMKDANDRLDAAVVASNVTRSVALHLQSPILNINHSLEWAVWEIHKLLGLPPDDPSTTFRGARFEPTHLRHEDVAGNPLQAALVVAALGFLPFRRRDLPWQVVAWGVALLVAFGLMCVLIRWHPWHSRLHLPLFFAAGPFVAWVLPWIECGAFRIAATAVCFAYALPFVTDNAKKPLFGRTNIFVQLRDAQYFWGDGVRYRTFKNIAHEAKARRYASIGIQADTDSMYYPLWPYLRKATKRPIAVYQVNVINPTRKLSSYSPPDAVVIVSPTDAETASVGEVVYRRIIKARDMSLYEREDFQSAGTGRK